MVPERLRSALALLVVLGVALFCALRPIGELDVFWHLAVGRWIVQHHTLPQVNVWSAADPGQAYHPSQWLWDTAAALLDERGGLGAVRLANAAWITASFVLAYVLLRRGDSVAVSLLLTLVLLAAFQDRVRVRPHVINLAGEVLLTYFVARYTTLRRTHLLLALLGFLLWSSLHAGGAWIAMLMLAAVSLFGVVWERVLCKTCERREGLLLVALSCCVGWLLSPGSIAWFGVHDDAAMIVAEEWRAWPALVAAPGWQRLPHVILVRAFMPLAIVAWVAVALRWRKITAADSKLRDALGTPRELAWAALCIALSCFAWRFFYFAALALIALRMGWRRLGATAGVVEPTPSRASVLVPLCGAALLGVLSAYAECLEYPSYAEAWGSRSETVDDRYLPVLGTQILVESRLDARVATLPDWGGYVIYAGWPKLRTTIDGRYTAPEDVRAITRQLEDIFNTGRNVDALPELYDKLPADFVLMPRRRYTARLPLLNWTKVATGAVEDLYIRKVPGSTEWIETLRLVIERHRLTGIPNHVQ